MWPTLNLLYTLMFEKSMHGAYVILKHAWNGKKNNNIRLGCHTNLNQARLRHRGATKQTLDLLSMSPTHIHLPSRCLITCVTHDIKGVVGLIRPTLIPVPHRAAQPKTSALRILWKYRVGISVGQSCWLQATPLLLATLVAPGN